MGKNVYLFFVNLPMILVSLLKIWYNVGQTNISFGFKSCILTTFSDVLISSRFCNAQSRESKCKIMLTVRLFWLPCYILLWSFLFECRQRWNACLVCCPPELCWTLVHNDSAICIAYAFTHFHFIAIPFNTTDVAQLSLPTNFIHLYAHWACLLQHRKTCLA